MSTKSINKIFSALEEELENASPLPRAATVEDAKHMTVEQLKELGRFALRVLALDLGLFEDEAFKVAFQGMGGEEQAQHLHGVLQKKSTIEAANLAASFTPLELATRVLLAENQLQAARIDTAALGKHVMFLDKRLIAVRGYEQRERDEHSKSRSALRKIKSALTPAMRAQIKKSLQAKPATKKTKKKVAKKKSR